MSERTTPDKTEIPNRAISSLIESCGIERSRLSYSFLGPSVMDGLPLGSRDALFGGGVRIEKPLVVLRTERENDRPCQFCMT